MNGREAIAYIHSQQWEKRTPGLHRIRRLLELLGNPQDGLKFVHVAGTNGKGSVCACLASMLQSAGYRVGLCTSPYLEDFRERIQVDRQPIPETELGVLTQRVRAAAEQLEESPSEFELITAIAMLHFRRSWCHIVVLEVGLGGTLDASNVISVPEAAVITAIGLDHTALLGNTLAEVADAKAGIIKPGGAVVSFGGCPEADAVIRRRCQEQGAFLTEMDPSRLTVRSLTPQGSTLEIRPYGPVHLALAGGYQPANALLAVTTAEVLRSRGWRLPDEAIFRGLSRVTWPGRMELLSSAGPMILRDGAHNPQGMAAAAESIRQLFPGKKVVAVLGIMADKDAAHMLPSLLPLTHQIFTVAPNNPRAMDPEVLAQAIRQQGVPAAACGDVEDALRRAVSAAGPDGVVCALGSLYLMGPVRLAVEEL